MLTITQNPHRNLSLIKGSNSTTIVTSVRVQHTAALSGYNFSFLLNCSIQLIGMLSGLVSCFVPIPTYHCFVPIPTILIELLQQKCCFSTKIARLFYTCYWQKFHAIYIACDWHLAVVYLAYPNEWSLSR